MNMKTPPAWIVLEQPTTNLACLVMSVAMKRVTAELLAQWNANDAFRPLAKYGIHPTRQALFYGPPGNGKTTGCQWLAKQLGVPLYRVRCEQLVHAHLGQTPKNVASIFDWLRGTEPAVILLDEVESLFPARGSESGDCGREMSSAMTVYWQALDRWTQRHLFVLATNMPEQLDPALMSRIELKVEFAAPTETQASMVIDYWAETLHEYGGREWARELRDSLEDGHQFESFRELWHAIQRRVTAHVMQGLAP